MRPMATLLNESTRNRGAYRVRYSRAAGSYSAKIQSPLTADFCHLTSVYLGQAPIWYLFDSRKVVLTRGLEPLEVVSRRHSLTVFPR